MKNPPEVRAGDVVRVVLEGPVAYAATAQGYFTVGQGGRNGIVPRADHVKSVEIVKPPVRVGDVIPQIACPDLPLGSLVRGTGSRHIWFHSERGWVDAQTVSFALGNMAGEYEVLYLPEQ